MHFNPYYLYSLMRTLMLGVIVVLCFTEVLIASSVNAQLLHKKVTLDVHDGSIAEAVKSLEAKNILIAYDAAKYNLDNRKINSRRFVSKPIRDVLTYIFNGTDLGFRETGAYIILEKTVPQRPGRISGTVYDERGLPLIGASVKVLGNKTVQTGIDGTYNMELPAGTYVVEVSYISYKTQRVQAIKVAAGQRAALDVAMEISSERLEDVVVTTTFKKASVAGLYAAQKNAASVTDGISAEQIARTPDINMAGSIKRISGVTTMDNKYVIVRGMSDRYNQAMLDGITIPSSSMNKRNFSFDVIPTEVVSSVVVNKTATPDMSAEFSGGQVSVNTLDIPEQNFTSIQLGTGGNAQSTGKDFYRLGQGSTHEFFTFPQEKNKLPENILNWYWHNEARQKEIPPPGTDVTGNMPLDPGNPNGPKYSDLDAAGQSRRFNVDALTKYKYKALPYQNYRLSLGRVYELPGDQRLGFVASTSFRNEQNILDFNNVRGQDHSKANYIDSTGFGQNGAGKSYRSMSALSAVANIGYQNPKLKLSLKNLYSRVYHDNYNEAYRLPYSDVTQVGFKEEFQQPELLTLWQHKLDAEYLLPADFRLQLSGTMNRIGQQIIDQRKLKYLLTTIIGDTHYFQTPNIMTLGALANDVIGEDSRMWSEVDETDYYWQAAFTHTLGAESAISTLLKIGYAGYQRQRGLSATRLIPYTHSESQIEKPYDVVLAPEHIGVGVNEAYYYANYYNGTVFDGKLASHALYAMADQKLLNSKLRLIYGLRAEFFNLRNQQDVFLNRLFPDGIPAYYSDDIEPAEKGWKLLPSLNAIYSVTSKFNVRASYGKTVIRPDLRETSLFEMYDNDLDGLIAGRNLKSTTIDNVDLRLEWYPSAGEVLSVSGFYKYLDKPIELAQDDAVNSGYRYNYQNQHSAVNYGLEAEIRKSLNFLGDRSWLAETFLYANGTLMTSQVEAMSFPRYSTTPPGIISKRRPMQDRPLIGQSPWLLNAGAGYWGDYAGITMNYNAIGYRTFISSADVRHTEFEVLPKQLDLQLYGRFLNRKAEVAFNIANLLNEWAFYYRNSEDTYEQVPTVDDEIGGYKVVGDLKYEPEKGDIITYRRREGRRFVLTLKYNF
ncbi:TonB-dependent receptor [Sphingobacterium sp. Ka21]|uniref:TonB-dependent receptor n=2 Tax=Sphingobacterium pedocola TaxID=2082722 RepID=A0ABR9T6J1_9SPHI|nr:TonB-dependent receptor [Sphingobacterium pedocola]